MGLINLSRWQQIAIILVALWALLYSLPNLLPTAAQRWLTENMPAGLPAATVSLGLDLRGGSHLLLQVETDAVIKDFVDLSLDQARTLLRKNEVRYSNLSATQTNITLQVPDAAFVDQAKTALAPMLQEYALSENNQQLTLSLLPAMMQERKLKALEQSIEIVRRRIDETGTREPSIQRQGQDRIVVQLPGVDDPGAIKRLLGQTAKMTFHLVDESANPADLAAGRVPPGYLALPSAENPGQLLAVARRVMVSGDNLVSSGVTYEQGLPAVSFRFDSIGGERFGNVTKDNIGRVFAIVLDGKVISAPVIRSAILGGSGIISGNFTTQSANELAILLRAGALPAPLQVIEERTVGPGLGADSIQGGMLAAIISMIAVVAMMVWRYKLFGVFASVALLFNIGMIFALLSVLQATLTLPGIAGIILIIGTAVDANVLIFERIKEELRNGNSIIAALDKGYSNALSAVIDANVTNLIAAFLLFALGSGPIKGFGVTLSIGTITSMFTAIMLTRLMVVWWYRSGKHKSVPV